MCGTNLRPCCSSEHSQPGEWYYPNGTIIYSISFSRSQSFYSSRGDDGTVRLNHPHSSVTPVGIFRCEIPNMSSEVDVVFVELSERNKKFFVLTASIWLALQSLIQTKVTRLCCLL